MLINCDMYPMGDSCHNEAILEFFQIQVGHVQPPLEIRSLLFQPLTTLNSPPFFSPRVSIFGFGRVSLCPFPTFVSEFTRCLCLVLRGWPSEGSQSSRQKIQARSWRPDRLIWFLPSTRGPITPLPFTRRAASPHQALPLPPSGCNSATTRLV